MSIDEWLVLTLRGSSVGPALGLLPNGHQFAGPGIYGYQKEKKERTIENCFYERF